MSLRGWLNILDNLTPRCRRCNRKVRNVLKCKVCGAVVCSENCFEKHFKANHPSRGTAPAPDKKKGKTAYGCMGCMGLVVLGVGCMGFVGVFSASMTQEAKRQAGKAAGEAPPEEEPIPSLVRPGKTGAAAYDLYPEPWRSRFVKEWQEKVASTKKDIDAAVRKWQEALAAAKKDLADEEEHIRRMESQGIMASRDKQLKAARERVPRLQGIGPDGASRQAKACLRDVEKNEPPYFASQEDKQEAEFAALPAPEQERRRELRRKRQAWLAKQ